MDERKAEPIAGCPLDAKCRGRFPDRDSIADFRLIRPRVIVPEKKARREP
jgi:hypothetical protein